MGNVLQWVKQDILIFISPFKSSLDRTQTNRIHSEMLSPFMDKGLILNTHTYACTQSHIGDINEVCGCWLSCERMCVCVRGGRQAGDRWKRLMSEGIGRIVRHLMNECKLATVKLIPPPWQDWKFSPLHDLCCESSSDSSQCNQFSICTL